MVAMRSLVYVLLTSIVLIAGCSPTAPTAAVPTNPPLPPTVPSALAAASPSAGPAVNAPLIASGPPTAGFVLQSSAFTPGGNLPTQYSCDAPGGGHSPPLSWSGAPAASRSFALVDQDPDAGGGGSAFTHWVVFNIPPSVTQLDTGLPAGDSLPNGALQGQNGRRVTAYQGACPPAGGPRPHCTFPLF